MVTTNEKELLDALADVLWQACGCESSGELDSMATSAYEHGIEILIKHNRAEIIPAGRLIAKLKQSF